MLLLSVTPLMFLHLTLLGEQVYSLRLFVKNNFYLPREIQISMGKRLLWNRDFDNK